MKKPAFVFLLATLLLSCKENKKDPAIAHITSTGQFEIDSVSAKSKIYNGIKSSVKDFTADKTEIIKINTIGEKSIEVYFIQCTDFKEKTRAAKYLFIKDNKLYFAEDIIEQKQNDPDEIFYKSYYVSLNNLSDSCKPNIAVFEGGYMWGMGNRIVCDKKSPCLGQQIVSF